MRVPVRVRRRGMWVMSFINEQSGYWSARFSGLAELKKNRERKMDFDHTQKVKDLIGRLEAFMDQHVYPSEQEHHDWNSEPTNLWKRWPGIEKLKQKARAEGLWNLFLPEEYGEYSPGLTNLEYAPLAEIMGRVPSSSEYFNCSAPDTGNMEVLAKFVSAEHKERWLKPLLNGDIRSAYVMTEPQVASSDATNLELTILIQ